MVHAPRKTGGVIQDQLHPEHRKLSATERDGPGITAQNGSLIVPGLIRQSRAYLALVLPWEVDTLPHQASDDPGRG